MTEENSQVKGEDVDDLQNASSEDAHTNAAERLALMRVYDPHEIPLHLWQDSMDAILDDKQIQNIYDHLGSVLQNTDSVLLYKYVDVEKGTEEPEGVLWLVVDFIMDAVTCVFISVNPEYRGQNVVGRSLAFAEALCREYGLGRVYGVASHPKWAERWGVRQTGQQIMVKEVE